MIWKKPEKLKRRLLEKQYEYILSPDFTLDRLVTHRVTARNFVIPELIKYYRLFSEDVSRLAFQSQSFPRLGN